MRRATLAHDDDCADFPLCGRRTIPVFAIDIQAVGAVSMGGPPISLVRSHLDPLDLLRPQGGWRQAPLKWHRWMSKLGPFSSSCRRAFDSSVDRAAASTRCLSL
jgi:hypothetical protein